MPAWGLMQQFSQVAGECNTILANFVLPPILCVVPCIDQNLIHQDLAILLV